MKIAVVGSGKVGGALSEKWAGAGHEVTFGVREPMRKQAERTPENPDIPFETIPDAIGRSQVIVFAIPGGAMDSLIHANAHGLAGKLLIDTTNDFEGASLSHVETLVSSAEGAKVFRAFNSLGWENFADPTFGRDTADLFYCGPDSTEAQQAFEAIVRDVGMRPIRVGDLDQVSIVDSVIRLWFSLAVGRGMGRHLAFKVLSE
ncbi:MAG TPA: NAD(P)-binding domain-containing protein [Anaerolineales bacterium]|nr:NAD(P)-binding domain-containing protein [Anaerolineales bacterium]